MGGGRLRLALTMLALCLGACGASAAGYDSTHSAAQILADASTAMSKTTSYHVSLTGNFSTGLGAANLDVEGDNYRGNITVAGIPARVVVYQAEIYVYGADFAKVVQTQNPQAAAIVSAKAGDRWIHLPPGSSGRVTDIIDVSGLASCIKAAVGIVKKSTSTVDGQTVVEVDDLAASKFYIATAAPHYPIRLSLTSAEACLGSDVTSETVDLSEFGKKFNLEAPPGFIDLTVLLGG